MGTYNIHFHGEIRKNINTSWLRYKSMLSGAIIIAPHEGLFFSWKVSILFLFLDENICYGYSLEVPH